MLIGTLFTSTASACLVAVTVTCASPPSLEFCTAGACAFATPADSARALPSATFRYSLRISPPAIREHDRRLVVGRIRLRRKLTSARPGPLFPDGHAVCLQRTSMNKPLVPMTEVSTDQVPPDQRVAFWESYNASALIGLRCSAFAAQGLRARARSFDLDTVRITEICGNEHVVERAAPMLRTHPKDSIFACLLLEGEGF